MSVDHEVESLLLMASSLAGPDSSFFPSSMSVDHEVESLLLMASSLAGPHSSIFVMAVDSEVESLTAA